MAVGHKEMRFLFPVSFAFIFLVITGLDNGVLNIRPHKGYAVLLKIMLVFNGCLLVFKLLTPAEEAVKYYKFMYDYAAANKTTIIYFQKSPYNIAELEVNFYKNQQAAVVQAKNSEEVAALINSHPDNSFIYLSQSLQPDTVLNGFKTERIYSAFPDFLLANNFNHWQERSRIWAVYRVFKK
jgi:phosphatidylinositol glycan class B